MALIILLYQNPHIIFLSSIQALIWPKICLLKSMSNSIVPNHVMTYNILKQFTKSSILMVNHTQGTPFHTLEHENLLLCRTLNRIVETQR